MKRLVKNLTQNNNSDNSSISFAQKKILFVIIAETKDISKGIVFLLFETKRMKFHEIRLS